VTINRQNQMQRRLTAIGRDVPIDGHARVAGIAAKRKLDLALPNACIRLQAEVELFSLTSRS
jgi:hypothetical protein